MADKYTIFDYPFDAETTQHKRADLNYYFAINCTHVPNAHVDNLYEMLRGIFTFDFSDEMKDWLRDLVMGFDYGNQETRHKLEDVLSAARKNTVHSHDSAAMYDQDN